MGERSTEGGMVSLFPEFFQVRIPAKDLQKSAPFIDKSGKIPHVRKTDNGFCSGIISE